MNKRNYRSSKGILFAFSVSIFLCLLIGLAWNFIANPIIIIAVGLLPLAIFTILRQPFFFVLLFVIFSFFRIHEAFPLLYNFKIPLLLSLASLGALIWHIGLSGKITIYWSSELTTLSLFFVLTIIGVLLATNRPIALKYFQDIYVKIMIMTFAITWLSRTEKDFALASFLITFFGMLVGLVALSNKINSIGLVEGTRVTIGRDIGSILGDPNDLSLVLMFPVAFACSLATTSNIALLKRLLGIISAVILFLAIIATQSRGGLLGVLAIFSVYAYRRIQSKTLFFTCAILAGCALFIFAGISGRSSGGAAEEGIDASSMGRLYAWEAAFGMAVDNPFSGVGLNNFYSNYYFYSPHWDGLNHAVHSTWFGVLAETGFLGLIVFVTTIVKLVRTALHSLNQIEQNLSTVNPEVHATAQAVFAGLVGTIVSASFLTQAFTWPIYILASLVVAIGQWNYVNLPRP